MNIVKHIFSTLGSIICLAALGCILFFMVYQIHPEQSSIEKRELSTMVLSDQISNQTTNLQIDVLNNYMSNNNVIKKIYKIEKGQAVPKPDATRFGSLPCTEAASLMPIIEGLEQIGLLEGQQMVFDPNASFYPGSEVQFYYDDTILVICWQEVINGSVSSFAEVKVADPSQFRRKLAGDSYGAGRLMYLSELYNQSNAVVAMNADFYSFRNLGVTCFEGTIRRTEETLDTLFIDKNGDFIFSPRRLGKTTEDYQQLVNENGVDFSISFGPIMIKDGELQNLNGYPIGEVDTRYSRAGLCQVDSLHYLYAQVGHYVGYRVATLKEFAAMLASKGVKQAYNIDGGQTGELVMNKKIVNHIDFGSERTVSDMIYFASALPNEGENN